MKNNTYQLVEWPESQVYMDEKWFNKEAVLANPSDECHELAGKYAAYFIPINRIFKK